MGLACLFSCKKNKEEQDPSPTTNPYYQSSKGDYWVYNTYKIDTGSDTEELIKTDSVVVSGDTLINGKRYTVYSGTWPFSSQWRELNILRDSSGCLVDNNGVVQFSSKNTSDTLSTSYVITGLESEPDTFIVFKWFMEGPSKVIDVPAGSFTVLNGIQKLTEPNSGVTTKFSHCYAPGVGLVLSQISYEYQIRAGIYYEQRLIRYHISS